MAVGSTPFGMGTPAVGEDVPTGPAGSRYLDPLARDYVVDPSSGQYQQMPSVRQRVLITVITMLGSSSSQPLFGVQLPQRMDERFEADARGRIRAALSQLIDIEQVMVLDGQIKVERGLGGRARFTIPFFDLTTGERHTVSGP
ncbi:MAG TPA: hypothetical protein VFW03_23185 [Gemmatimonadaceae bacterium]|nr:hypothetical protein [Gemmatimonadaceae bacterium]